MESNETFKYYGNYDVSKLQQILSENNFDWYEWDFRAKKFPNLYQTQTVPILFDESWEFKYVQKHKHYPLFEEEIIKLENYLQKDVFKKDGFILNALLVRLLSKNSIKRHIDNGLHFHRSIFTRIHIPIFTNDNCIFTCGGEEKNFKVGEMWDPNYTMQFHEVNNMGDTDRINLIFDWVEKTPTEVRV